MKQLLQASRSKEEATKANFVLTRHDRDLLQNKLNTVKKKDSFNIMTTVVTSEEEFEALGEKGGEGKKKREEKERRKNTRRGREFVDMPKQQQQSQPCFLVSYHQNQKKTLRILPPHLLYPSMGQSKNLVRKIGEYPDTYPQSVSNARLSGMFASHRRAPLGAVTITSGLQNQQQRVQTDIINQMYAPSLSYWTVPISVYTFPPFHLPSFQIGSTSIFHV